MRPPMKRLTFTPFKLAIRLVTISILTFMYTATSYAAEKTVVLDVPTMNCVTCPITVKKALQKVDGVLKAEVTYDPNLATVTFDDQKTSVKALTQATTNAGYPSTVSKTAKND
jgi:periplasmic mercuric ion binding protein